ncbi:hypothetical protein B0H16DRAFT_1714616 [Mycena metata]|uniref:Uncharacterized protein n=1 Tax=Mycena metata TaxID=1033252 RepID=A0AAD7JX82_9AGAR|nr:hypothetical protein B0H16DRAFT_1714616 [Mycena metata]
MHPALRLSALNVLPYIVKRTALAAAASSKENLYEMQCLIAAIHFNDDGEKLRLFLPVFYANLDRAKIPIGDGLDDLSIFTAGPVHLAMVSLQQICTMTLFIPLPSDIFSDLWPKLWKWVQFSQGANIAALVISASDTHPTGMRNVFAGSLPLSLDDETGPGISFVKFVSMFLLDKIAKGILTSTPGVRCMVARSWILLLQTSNPVVGYGFDTLTMILHSPAVVASRADAEEFIEGAGGGVEDLASLIVGLMRNNVSAYTTHIPHLIAKAVHLLIVLFLTTSGARMIPDALRAGLLYVVVSCSMVNQFTKDLKMLVKVLTASLMSYTTLSVLEDSLATVQEISKSPKFLSSSVFKLWKRGRC